MNVVDAYPESLTYILITAAGNIDNVVESRKNDEHIRGHETVPFSSSEEVDLSQLIIASGTYDIYIYHDIPGLGISEPLASIAGVEIDGQIHINGTIISN